MNSEEEVIILFLISTTEQENYVGHVKAHTLETKLEVNDFFLAIYIMFIMRILINEED